MQCEWNQYVNLFPFEFRQALESCRETLQQANLRVGYPMLLQTKRGVQAAGRAVTAKDLEHIISMATQYSPWSSETIRNGYITAPGGHRIGICGTAVIKDDMFSGFRTISSLCIRRARIFTGISKQLWQLEESILIIGAPGWGKTTLLRDLIYQKSKNQTSNLSVIDERGELFPQQNGVFLMQQGSGSDILTGCSKICGINMLLRSMCPEWIAVDEITAEEDCEALLRACWCGVRLIATAHAGSKRDLFSRSVYKPLTECGMFRWLVLLQRDKSWTVERLQIT